MDGDDFFLTARGGSIWACWLSGKPAVNLGSEATVLAAIADLQESLAPAQTTAGASIPPPRDQAPVPAPAPAAAPPPEVDRREERFPLTIRGKVFTGTGRFEVTILDLSAQGCRFHDQHILVKEGAKITVRIGPIGPIDATVRWQEQGRVGVSFDTPLYPSVLDHIRRHFDVR